MAQILSDFLVETPQGYYCKYGEFYIDPLLPVHTAVISHAHGDHARPGHANIYATPATIAFMKMRFVRQPVDSYSGKEYGESFIVRGVHISFIPAGHILGSAQIRMEYEGVVYLYSGDIKSQYDPTCEPIVHVKADVLITETTFANPEVKHPDPIEEIKKLNETSNNIMLGCYGLGKAQRINALLNTYCPEKVVYVHHNILPIHRIYDQIGLVPLKYEIYHRKVMKDGRDKIYLVPPIMFNNYSRATNVLRVFASGWQRLQRHNDIELYVSDHVDWNDLLAYIHHVEPQEIWTVHGDGRWLIEELSDRIEVRDL